MRSKSQTRKLNAFVDIWNAAVSPQEVAELLDMTYSSVCSRASQLRGQGFDLQSFITPEHFSRIGSKGGKAQVPKGFSMDRERARNAWKMRGQNE